MMILQWLRFGAVAFLILSGLFALFITTVGIFRFDYVLNRIHVAAKCDTMGILLVLGALMLYMGFGWATLKLLLLIVFLWIANPVSSHLIAHLEVATNDNIEKECEVVYLDDPS